MAIVDRDRTGAEEKTEAGRVKGVMVKNHLDWLEEKRGEPGIRQVIEASSSETADELKSVLASNWYPFSLLIEVDRAIAEVAGNPIETYRDLGRHSARKALSSTYRVFKRDDFAEFLRRSTPLHGQFQDFGAVSYDSLSNTSAVVDHLDYPCFSPVYCESALGYFEEVARIHGIEDPVVEEVSCQTEGDPSCRIKITWSTE